jgi:hypothetical protein
VSSLGGQSSDCLGLSGRSNEGVDAGGGGVDHLVGKSKRELRKSFFNFVSMREEERKMTEKLESSKLITFKQKKKVYKNVYVLVVAIFEL